MLLDIFTEHASLAWQMLRKWSDQTGRLQQVQGKGAGETCCWLAPQVATHAVGVERVFGIIYVLARENVLDCFAYDIFCCLHLGTWYAVLQVFKISQPNHLQMHNTWILQQDWQLHWQVQGCQDFMAVTEQNPKPAHLVMAGTKSLHA